MTDALYRINDVLAQLASELGVAWGSDETEDATLNDLTHEVAQRFGVVATCRWCQRRVVRDPAEGWADPQATGDDAVWRYVCDAHDTFTAEHEPEERDRMTEIEVHLTDGTTVHGEVVAVQLRVPGGTMLYAGHDIAAITPTGSTAYIETFRDVPTLYTFRTEAEADASWRETVDSWLDSDMSLCTGDEEEPVCLGHDPEELYRASYVSDYAAVHELRR
jgi:hypothetical protein